MKRDSKGRFMKEEHKERWIKGWKGFDDIHGTLYCRDKVYKEGEVHTVKGSLKMCENGMHFCKNPLDVLKYYSPECSVYGKVEGAPGLDGPYKLCTNKLKVIKVVSSLEFVNAILNYGQYRGKHFEYHDSTKDDIIVGSENVIPDRAVTAGLRCVAAAVDFAASCGSSSIAYSTDTRSIAVNASHCGLALNSGVYGMAVSNGLSQSEVTAAGGIAVNSSEGSVSAVEGAVAIGLEACTLFKGKKGAIFVALEIDAEPENLGFVGVHWTKVDGEKIKEDEQYYWSKEKGWQKYK